MKSVTRFAGPIYLGLDVHKNSISAAVLRPDEDAPGEVVKILSDFDAVTHLLGRFDDLSRLRVSYEAGPTGYELHRFLAGRGVRCEVIAPSLVPKAPGDRVKTDRRDCRRLARLHRAGELTAIRVPTPEEEAVRDLCRTRGDMLDDLQRAQRRLGAFLLRHGRVYRETRPWTQAHERWLARQHFEDPMLRASFEHYLAAVTNRRADLAAIEPELAVAAVTEPFADPVTRLAAYRGIARLGALTLAAEVGDWRRFPAAGAFMGFTGLVPSEHSSGESSRRGAITKTGNAHVRTQLIEAAWSYQHRARIGPGLQARHIDVPPATLARSWAAQQRLCRRFRVLAARKNTKSVVATAIARELAGFLWAEMTS